MIIYDAKTTTSKEFLLVFLVQNFILTEMWKENENKLIFNPFFDVRRAEYGEKCVLELWKFCRNVLRWFFCCFLFRLLSN
jgi:hypothetical protein